MGPIPSFLIGLSLGTSFGVILANAKHHHPVRCYLCGDPLRSDEALSVNPPYIHMDCRLAEEQARTAKSTHIVLPTGHHKKRRPAGAKS